MPFGIPVQLDKKARITLVLAAILAIVLLYFSLRGIDMEELGRTLRSARLGPIGLSILLSSIALWLRSYRWRVLLNSNANIEMGTVFWANSLGYLGNNILPARMGEIMRIAAINWSNPVSKSYVLATAVIERVVDAGVLVMLTSVALLSFNNLPDWLQRASQSFSILSGAGILTLFMLPHAETQVRNLLERFPSVANAASRFLEGLRSLHDFKRSASFLVLTLMIWPIDSLAALLVAQSINAPMDFQTCMIVLAALGLSSAVPSTPGYVGVFQFVAVNVLAPFGVTRAAALAWVLLYQAICYITQAVFGIMGFVVLSRDRARKAASAASA